MKQLFGLTTLTAVLATGTQAVELNTDALKTMQKEGDRIVEEAKGGRAYRAANNFCLDVAGNGLVVRKCNGGAKTQKWIMDGQGRLVAHDGRCVAGGQLAKCGPGNGQKWKHDGKNRLAGHNKQCLQIEGNTPEGGARVITAACNNQVSGQVWK